MAMERWRPLRPEMYGLRPFRELEEMERRFEDVLGRVFHPEVWRRRPIEERHWAPPIEMFEKEDKFVVMDVFEHAFITDYRLKQAEHIEAFFKNINWAMLESQLQ